MNVTSLKVILLAILACLLWSTAFVGIKIGLQYTTPLQFAGIRFFLAGIILIPFARNLQGYYRTITKHFKIILKVSAFQTILLYALFYYGIDLLPGSLAAIIIGSQPLFAAIVAHLFIADDKMGLRKTLIISSGIFGIVLIAARKGLAGPEGLPELLGIALLVLANIASGLGNVFVSKNKSSLSPIILNSSQMMIGGFILFLISLVSESLPQISFPADYFYALSWLSLISAGAFTIWFMLLQKPYVKVSDLNIYKFIIPVFGAVLSWVILPNESPDLTSIAGMLIIGASVVIYALQTGKATKK